MGQKKTKKSKVETNYQKGTRRCNFRPVKNIEQYKGKNRTRQNETRKHKEEDRAEMTFILLSQHLPRLFREGGVIP